MNLQISPFLSSLLTEIVLGLLDNDGSFVLPGEKCLCFIGMKLINITNYEFEVIFNMLLMLAFRNTVFW